MYKSLIKPVHTYGLQLWPMEQCEKIQNKTLHTITNAPPCVSNFTLHTDLNIKIDYAEAIIFYKRFHDRLHSYPNSFYIKFSYSNNFGQSTTAFEKKLVSQFT